MPAIETAGCMFLDESGKSPRVLLWQILTGCLMRKSHAVLVLCVALQGCALVQNEQAREANQRSLEEGALKLWRAPESLIGLQQRGLER